MCVGDVGVAAVRAACVVDCAVADEDTADGAGADAGAGADDAAAAVLAVVDDGARAPVVAAMRYHVNEWRYDFV